MSTISLTLPSDGQTIDASDVNTPFNTIANVINGGLDTNNITAGGLAPKDLVSGTGSTWVWQTWTPTWTNLTVGNGTLTAKYSQIGKAVIFKIAFVFGSTSSVSGDVQFTIPVTAASYTSPDTLLSIGVAELYDAAVASYMGRIRLKSTTNCQLFVENASSTYVGTTGITNLIPFTWGTGDGFSLLGVYEAA